LQCYEGRTDVSIFIYFDEGLSLEECDECKPPESDDDNVVAYQFDLSCEPICESLAPTRSPVTLSPTKAPVIVPPTDCYDTHGIKEENIIDKFGSNEPIPEDAIKIIHGENVNVTIEISQLWSVDANASVFLHYHTERHGSVCEGTRDLSYDDILVKNLECYEGWTDVGIFIYFDQELTLEECDECKPPDSDEENVIAYYIEVPCEPICESLGPSASPSVGASASPTTDTPTTTPTTGGTSATSSARPSGGPSASATFTEAPASSLTKSSAPQEAECHDGILVMQKDTTVDSICEYSSEPIIIEEFGESSSNEVRFSFYNNWEAPLTQFELYYDRGDGPECQSLNSLPRSEMYGNVLTAICDSNTHMADIEVYITSKESDSSLECGDKGARSCAYVYKIPCSEDVVCNDVRRLESNIGDSLENDANINIEQGFMTEEMKAAAEPSDESEDTPYCVHEDYPCKGDEENMVHVCHYSSRAGYQTFCIPEMDSDILRFNKQHHCGPCDGWNGVEHSGRVN